MRDYVGKRIQERRVGPRDGSIGRRAEDRERAAREAFLAGCAAREDAAEAIRGR